MQAFSRQTHRSCRLRYLLNFAFQIASNTCPFSHFRMPHKVAHFHISDFVQYLPIYTFQIGSNICPFSHFRLPSILARSHISDCLQYLPILTFQIASQSCPINIFSSEIASNLLSVLSNLLASYIHISTFQIASDILLDCPFLHFRLLQIFDQSTFSHFRLCQIFPQFYILLCFLYLWIFHFRLQLKSTHRYIFTFYIYTNIYSILLFTF